MPCWNSAAPCPKPPSSPIRSFPTPSSGTSGGAGPAPPICWRWNTPSTWRHWSGRCSFPRNPRGSRDACSLRPVHRLHLGLDPGPVHPLPAATGPAAQGHAAGGEAVAERHARRAARPGRIVLGIAQGREPAFGSLHRRLQAPVGLRDLRLPSAAGRSRLHPQARAVVDTFLRLVPGQDGGDRHRPLGGHQGAEGHGQGRRGGRRPGPPGDHLPRRHPRRPGRQAALPYGRRHAVRRAEGAGRAYRLEFRAFLASARFRQEARHPDAGSPSPHRARHGPQGLHGRAGEPYRNRNGPAGGRGPRASARLVAAYARRVGKSRPLWISLWIGLGIESIPSPTPGIPGISRIALEHQGAAPT
ncbi:protein of unknown function [Magnetospirillum sp. XM-1]|nr:protein of unknown function [Magnetospirillum sp. XM-1]